ncbi:MAG: hypothetical protein IKO78_02755 [Bacilli bacterium]|nr:hypothetical protein [Bacilli bacterium]
MKNLTQCDVILMAMLEHEEYDNWTAKDFQSGKYFVGYEATARMSELANKYPNLIIVGKDGKFRTLSINWKNKKEVKKEKKRLGIW